MNFRILKSSLFEMYRVEKLCGFWPFTYWENCGEFLYLKDAKSCIAGIKEEWVVVVE